MKGNAILECQERVLSLRGDHEILTLVSEFRKKTFPWYRCHTIVAIVLLLSSCAFCQGSSRKVSTPSESALVNPGVVVEKVEKGSEAELAGIKKGDVILSWSRGEKFGKIESPFDWSITKVEQATFENVTLRGFRKNHETAWNLSRHTIEGASVRQNFAEILLSAYAECQQKIDHSPIAASECMHLLAQKSRKSGLEIHSICLEVSSAQLLANTNFWQGAERIYGRILKEHRSIPSSVVFGILWARTRLIWQHDITQAATDTEELIRVARARDTGYIEYLGSLQLLTKLNWIHGDMAKANDYSLEELAVTERLFPKSHAVAKAATTIGSISLIRNDLVSAETFYNKALALEEPQESILAGQLFVNYATIAWRRGVLDIAEQYLDKAFKIFQKGDSDGPEIASCFEQLGTVSRDRGNLRLSEEYQLKALALFRKHHRMIQRGDVLNDLAYLSLYRGNSTEQSIFFGSLWTISRNIYLTTPVRRIRFWDWP